LTHVYRVATLNINGITSATRLRKLKEFLHKHDIDMALLQEITHPDLSTLRNYNAHINQGTEGSGTAILTKAELTVTNTKRLPSGRGIASIINGTWITNIYARSGAEKNAERERFYTNDLPHILPTTKSDMNFAGEFNCILETNESTGQKHFSRVLESIVNELDLHYVWNATSKNKGYTHYASKTASRLDRIYVTKHIRTRKTGVETIATAFTDHFAVVLQLAIEVPLPLRGRGY